MKTAVKNMLVDGPSAVDRRSFFKTLGLGTTGALALTGEAAADAAAGSSSRTSSAPRSRQR